MWFEITPNLGQRAEEIWHWIAGADRDRPSAEIIAYIAAALRQTREEAIKEYTDELNEPIKCGHLFANLSDDGHGKSWCDICQARKEALEEGIKLGIGSLEDFKKDAERINQLIRNEALEAAAKVAETVYEWDDIKMGGNRHLTIAKAIRALVLGSDSKTTKGRTFNHRDGQKELDRFESEDGKPHMDPTTGEIY
jgi:hypothetical protein